MARTEAHLDNCPHEPLWENGLVHSSSKARRHQGSPGQLESDTALLARFGPKHRLGPQRAILVHQRRISSQGFSPPCPSRRPCDVGGSFVTCHQFSLLEGALRGSQDTTSGGSRPNLHVPLYSQLLWEDQLALVLDSAVPKQDRSC